MPSALAPDIDSYWKTLSIATPTFSAEEQRVAVALYRELAKGAPVQIAQLVSTLGASTEDVERLLDQPSVRAMTYRDQHGPIVGFGGLATSPMHHRFHVGGRSLWTWCAWDSLFIPQLLGAAARVESPDPQTGDVVHLDVSPEIVVSPHPATAVMSFLAPDASAFRESAATVMSSFCHFIFLFTSRESGDLWVAKHPGTFLYSIDEAATLARRLNAKTFGHELARLTHDTWCEDRIAVSFTT